MSAEWLRVFCAGDKLEARHIEAFGLLADQLSAQPPTPEILRDCRRLIDTAGFYFKVDAKLEPRRRTAHLVVEARELLARIDGVVPRDTSTGEGGGE